MASNERKGHHVVSVRRHLTKNRPGLPQKSSEIPSISLLVKRERGPKDPAAHKGRGPKDPAAQTLNGVVAPFHSPARLLRQLLVHEQDRRCHGSSHSRQAAIPSQSRDSDSRRVVFCFVTPSGCWRHCAPIFATGLMPHSVCTSSLHSALRALAVCRRQ